MCANYQGIEDSGVLASYFSAVLGTYLPAKPEAWPTDLQAFVRLDANGRRVIESGHFGLLPHFAKEVSYGRKTYNARSETVATKPSFSQAWKCSQRCIVPAQWIFEPYYEGDLCPVRWKIQPASGEPMAIAGVYSTWKAPDGAEHHSFAMLTVNADSHLVMNQFHAPGEEKRMVVMLEPDEHDAWLTCSPDEARAFLKQWGGDLVAEPAPLRPRGKKAAPLRAPPPAPDLFGLS